MSRAPRNVALAQLVSPMPMVNEFESRWLWNKLPRPETGTPGRTRGWCDLNYRETPVK